MDYVNLGRTGVKVSHLCLGCRTYGTLKWRGVGTRRRLQPTCTSAAWESCINIFDTADMYSEGASEEVLGRTLRDLAISRE